MKECICNDAKCLDSDTGKLKTFNSLPDTPILITGSIQDCPKRMNLEVLESFKKI